MNEELQSLSQSGMKYFQKKQYTLAADYFTKAAELAHTQELDLDEAEQKNNLSVAMLFAGNPQQAYDAAIGTDLVFQAHTDLKRQAMALGNTAQALEELKRYPEALQLYEQATDLLKNQNEREIRSMLLHRKATLQAKMGKTLQSAATLSSAIDEKPKLDLKEKILQKVFNKVFNRKA